MHLATKAGVGMSRHHNPSVAGREVAEQALEKAGVECATRGKTMFRDQEKLQILRRFRQSLDPDAPWVGFYTVGEIAPVEGHNLRHLYTSVVLALR